MRIPNSAKDIREERSPDVQSDEVSELGVVCPLVGI